MLDGPVTTVPPTTPVTPVTPPTPATSVTPVTPVIPVTPVTKDEFHHMRSDKIRARILDLGSGAARRALQNLRPKSARILSAAITRTILLPAGVRGLVTNSTRC